MIKKELQNVESRGIGITSIKRIVENYGGEMMFVKTPDMHGNMFIIQTEFRCGIRSSQRYEKINIIILGTLFFENYCCV